MPRRVHLSLDLINVIKSFLLISCIHESSPAKQSSILGPITLVHNAYDLLNTPHIAYQAASYFTQYAINTSYDMWCLDIFPLWPIHAYPMCMTSSRPGIVCLFSCRHNTHKCNNGRNVGTLVWVCWVARRREMMMHSSEHACRYAHLFPGYDMILRRIETKEVGGEG